MAVTASPRLGLTRWSAGADPFRRSQLDGDHGILDDLVVIHKQGAFNDRPAAGVRGRFYRADDVGGGTLYYDDGIAWSPGVVLEDDPRLTDARPPTAHGHISGDVGLGNVPNVDATDAANLAKGTIPDARFPARIGTRSLQVADWDTVTASGFYYSVSGAANAPVATTLMGHVVMASANDVIQTVTAFGQGIDAATYRRIKTSGTNVWSPWAQIHLTVAQSDIRYGRQLARTSYNPAAGNTTTTSATLVDVDAANLKVTFTALTTQVDIELEAIGTVNVATTGTSALGVWGLRDGAGATVGADRSTVLSSIAGNTWARVRTVNRVTGLVVGNTYTYTWAHRINVATAGTAGTAYGGSYGPAVMEVYAR